MKRVFAVAAVIAVIGGGVYAFAAANEEPAKPGASSPRYMMGQEGGMQMGGMMSGMPMDMARRMGNGDTMLGMARMMEMMSSMGGMMGGDGGGMMGGSPHHQPMPKEAK